MNKGCFVLDVDDPYVYDLVKEELEFYPNLTLVEPQKFNRNSLLTPNSELKSKIIGDQELSLTYDPENDMYGNKSRDQHTVYYVEYERMDWDQLDSRPTTSSSIWYTNRKGLIRKAELVKTIENHLVKCAEPALRSSAVQELTHDECPEVVDDDNWYEFSDIDSDTDDESENQDGNSPDQTDQNGQNSEEANQNDGDDEDHEAEDDEDGDDDGGDDDDDYYDDDDDDNEPVTPCVFKSHEDCCPLQSHVPQSINFTIFNLSELDELLIGELPEIGALGGVENETANFEKGNVWILKPSMTNQARGITMIASTDAFRNVFEGPEGDENLSIRDWVVQKYIHPPFLLKNDKKFHLRVYVYASGALNLYIFDRVLALFSLQKYVGVGEDGVVDNRVHLTNTCYQKRASTEDDVFDEEECVMLFHEAVEEWAMQYLSIMGDWLNAQKAQICQKNDQNDQNGQKLAPRKKNQTAHNYQVHQLRAMIRYAQSVFSPSDVDSDDEDENEDEDDGEEKNETDNARENPDQVNADFSFNNSFFNPFLYFYKQVLSTFQTNPDYQSTLHPNTKISLIFDQDGVFDVKACARQIAIQFYFHSMAQIRTILQELFISCVNLNKAERVTYEPKLKPSTSLQNDQNDQNSPLFFDSFRSSQTSLTPQAPPPAIPASLSRSMNVKYKPIPNSSELYGFDFILDHRCKVFLLEANPGPDFGQTGLRLKSIVCQPLVRGLLSIMLQEKELLVRKMSEVEGMVAFEGPLHLESGKNDQNGQISSQNEQTLPQSVKDVQFIRQRAHPLTVQHSAGIVALKVVETEDRNGLDKAFAENGKCEGSENTEKPENSDPSQAPVFVNRRNETSVDDYIGCDGSSWLSEVMPTAPHFMPILHLPL